MRPLGIVVLIAIVASVVPITQAYSQEKKPGEILPAEKLADGWDLIDERLIFLMVRLANTEASLEVIEKAIAVDTRKKAPKIANAKRSDQANEDMDRKGGGPMKWAEFYGTTADKFFYHPTDRNSTYHTVTILTQQSPQNDNRAGEGVPSREGLPVHQRPPQFDYIYRANEKAKTRAQAEVAELQGKIQALTDRRHRLESEQAGLWCSIAFRAVQHFDLDKKPLFRFEAGAEVKRNGEAMNAATAFMATALSIVSEAEKDQGATFSRIKPTLSQARQNLNDAWLRLGVDATDRRSNLGRFAALAKRLDDVASNLSESYLVAIEGDESQDQQRKDTFRATLQKSFVSYAQIILALDEMAGLLKEDWKIKPDVDRPLKFTSIQGVTPVAKIVHKPVPQPIPEVPEPEEVSNLPPLKNSIGMELRLIPSGKFLMGSPDSEEGHKDFEGNKNHEVQHEVRITNAFYIGIHEITQMQYEQIMGNNPSRSSKGQKLPVDAVSWNEATEFCRRLSLLPREKAANHVYRLPTEAEWEYACRAGTTTSFSFGDDRSQLEEYAWISSNSGRRSKEVGTKKPNPWGLFDMHGNVFERCYDWQAEYPTQETIDPKGPQIGKNRVARGGSWGNDGNEVRSADRGACLPTAQLEYVGFRVVFTKPAEKPNPKR